LKRLNPGLQWSECAVLARTHEALEPVRAALEHVGVPFVYTRQDLKLPLGRVREIVQFFTALEPHRKDLLRAGDLEKILEQLAGQKKKANYWWELLSICLQAWKEETGNSEQPVQYAIDSLWEALVEQKRERFMGRGVFLSTVHYAKGMEFEHVFIADGGWKAAGKSGEEERRVFYVAMTRAKQTLSLFLREDSGNPYASALANDLAVNHVVVLSPGVAKPLSDAILRKRYDLLGLKDMFLDYAGRKSPDDPIHGHLSQINVGDCVYLKLTGEKLHFCNDTGETLAVLAGKAYEKWVPCLDLIQQVNVAAIVERRKDDTQDPDYQKLLKSEKWDVPIVEVVFSG